MSYLPIANITHRKLRSGLSMVAVGIGIAMLLVMLGMSHGTLNEVADRMASVNADLFIVPKGENIITYGGAPFHGKQIPSILGVQYNGKPLVAEVIPALFETARMADQQQRIFGVDPEQIGVFFGDHKLEAGRMFDPGARFKKLAEARRAAHEEVTDQELADACEMVIDSRLARVGGYRIGHVETILNHRFTVVGIVETGVAGRVFVPLDVLRQITQAGTPRAAMFFVKLRDPQLARIAAPMIQAAVKASVVPKEAYGQMLFDGFSQIYVFINVASGLALAVCFLFIMLTMYTMVVERTREIGILKSLGATRRYIVRLAVEESVLLCGGGTAIGIGLAFTSKYVIERLRPLLTVDIEMRWLLLAIAVGVIGGVVSALYPGYRAARQDPVTALAFE